MNLYDFTLAQIMYILSLEEKYSSKFYHYLESFIEEPIKCTPYEIDLKTLNKHDFGMLKNFRFDDFDMRELIEIETKRRNHGN